MKFAQAVALVESMCKDSTIKDSSLALQEVLRDLTKLAQSNTASPLMVIDAFEICEAIANGPEDSTSAEDIAWRAHVRELAQEIFAVKP
jgi:hypothetical protein